MLFEELLQAARAGSREDLGALLESFRPRLLAFVARLTRWTRPKLETPDLVQDTFLAATEHFSDFVDDKPQHMFRWLRRIVINRLCDESRRRKSLKRDVARQLPLEFFTNDLLAPPDSPDEDLPRELDLDRVRAALAALPRRHREIIVAYFWEGRTLAEIAAQTGRSEAAVRKAKSRALYALRKILADNG